MHTDLPELTAQLSRRRPVRAALAQYAAQLRQRSPVTVDRYQRTLTPFFQYLVATGQAIEAIDSIVMERYGADRFALAQRAMASAEPAAADPSRAQRAQDRVNREFAVINAFVNALIDAGVVTRSPGLAGFRYRAPGLAVSARPTVPPLTDDKYFSRPLWQRLHSGLATALAAATTEGQYRYFRWWQYRIAVLYGLALRASEAVSHSYADLVVMDGVWKLRVLGKGRKFRNITVDNHTLEEMTRYLAGQNLTLDAARQAKLPLIPGRYAARAPSRHALYLGFQTLQTKLGWTAPERRELHALRHTRATHLAGVLQQTQLMDFLGHSKAETTRIYYHSDEDVRDRINSLNPVVITGQHSNR